MKNLHHSDAGFFCALMQGRLSERPNNPQNQRSREDHP